MRAKPSSIIDVKKEKEQGGSLRKIKKHGSIRFNSNVGFEEVSIDKADRKSTACNSVGSDLQ